MDARIRRLSPGITLRALFNLARIPRKGTSTENVCFAERRTLLMENDRKFETIDGVPAHPLLAHKGLSPTERAAAERADVFARWKNGEVIDLSHFGIHLERER